MSDGGAAAKGAKPKVTTERNGIIGATGEKG